MLCSLHTAMHTGGAMILLQLYMNAEGLLLLDIKELHETFLPVPVIKPKSV